MNLYGIEIYESFLYATAASQAIEFELNLYGIEISQTRIEKPLSHACLNWTFMELKFRLYCIPYTWFCCLNWTFMELKSYKKASLNHCNIVWIEPLWNWNMVCLAGFLFEICLNWTFMELKCAIFRVRHEYTRVWIEPLWNWNSLPNPKTDVMKSVWIEPLWNWNNEYRELR